MNPLKNITPVVKNLLIINFLFYLAKYLLINHINLDQYLAAYYPGSPYFRIWQVVTYMFMHSIDPAHIFSNMLGLFFLGPIIEQTLGSKRFLNYYFICGIGALGLQYLVQMIEMKYMTGSFFVDLQTFIPRSMEEAQTVRSVYGYSIVGASGAVFGLSAALFVLYPELEMYIYLIPIPIRVKYLVPIYMAIEIGLTFMHVQGDNIAHLAHIGGAVVGFIVIKLWQVNKSNNFS